MNPDADTTRIVRAEQFQRLVNRLVVRGVDRNAAEVCVGLSEPHLACAWEQLRHPPQAHPEISRHWWGQA